MLHFQFRHRPHNTSDHNLRHSRPAVHVAVDVRVPTEFCTALLQHGLAETSGKVILKLFIMREPFVHSKWQPCVYVWLGH